MDGNGVTHIAKFFDPNLLNPWGISESATSPFWLADNGAGVSTLYNTPGMPQSLIVSIPSPSDPLGTGGAPTGTVFNAVSGTGGFPITGVTSAGAPITAPAMFLFATEDGTILGWNPGVNPVGFNPAKAGTYAIIAVNNSPGAVYKGLAMATDANGITRLYATNFRAGTVDVFDTGFHPLTTPGAFQDPFLSRGFAPFNIVPVTVGGTAKLIVTYAVQDRAKHDDVAGVGNGIVASFPLDGSRMQLLSIAGPLNSPWGVTVTPAGFGPLAGTLWIGNFGDGHINAYDPVSGLLRGSVTDPNGKPVVIDGLWSLTFGNGGNGGLANTLYFTAGPNGEQDGLFGSLAPQTSNPM